jgi:hypothetical protein
MPNDGQFKKGKATGKTKLLHRHLLLAKNRHKSSRIKMAEILQQKHIFDKIIPATNGEEASGVGIFLIFHLHIISIGSRIPCIPARERPLLLPRSISCTTTNI